MNEVSPHMRKKLDEVVKGEFKLTEIPPHEEVRNYLKTVRQ